MTKTDVVTLGINDGHTAGAALVRNGQVVAAIQEERLVNIKNYSGVPRLAIHEVFRIGGIHPQDVDAVAIVSLNRVYAPNVPIAEIPSLLRPIFVEFGSHRALGEGFGDWVERVGFEALRERVEQTA